MNTPNMDRFTESRHSELDAVPETEHERQAQIDEDMSDRRAMDRWEREQDRKDWKGH